MYCTCSSPKRSEIRQKHGRLRDELEEWKLGLAKRCAEFLVFYASSRFERAQQLFDAAQALHRQRNRPTPTPGKSSADSAGWYRYRVLSSLRTSSMPTTSPYFALMSKRFASCGAAFRSATHSRGTIGRKPCCMASTAVARTHPLVETPVIISVSMVRAVNLAASEVPKKALAYCFVIIVSPGCGASEGIKPASGSPSTIRRKTGTLRTNHPPSVPFALYMTRV